MGMELTEVVGALETAGFVHDDESKDYMDQFADKADMHAGGPYVVHGVWKRGMITIHVEQNTTTESQDGVTTTVTHQPVAVISGPNGKVSSSLNDIEAILVAADLMG